MKTEDDFLGDEAVTYLNCGSDYATVKSYRNAYQMGVGGGLTYI